jgi:hypothetical protein
MPISSSQRLANFPSMLPAAPGAIEVQTAGPQAAALLASGGTFTLNGATPVAVVNARVTANSIIIFTLKTVTGTVSPTAPNVLTITPGTGFTVGGVALDLSDYNYCVLG